jgi:hypothetical protein
MSKLLDNKLIIGKPYYNAVKEFKVTPVVLIDNNRALFCTDEFPRTPYVIWSFLVLDNDTIDLYNGDYYTTLESALINRHPDFQPWHFRVTYYCKDCGAVHTDTIYVDACKSVQDIVENFEDLMVCPDCGTTTNRCIIGLALEQSYNYYKLPLTR